MNLGARFVSVRGRPNKKEGSGTNQYRKASLIPLVLVGLMFAAPAWGHTQTRLDPDDTPSPLDIVVARHSHRVTDSGLSLTFRLVTYETWEFGDDHKAISVEFNLDSDDAIERCAVVDRRLVGGVVRLRADVYRNCTEFGEGERVGGTRDVTRPDQHSLRLSFAKHLLGKDVRAYRWRIVTGYGDPESEECRLRAPVTRYGSCTDVTAWTRHAFEVDDD